MSTGARLMFDRDALGAAIKVHGKVARIILVQVKGSAPRAAGTSMLVWQTGSLGTIGGGQLEWQSMKEAREMLSDGSATRLRHAALGPALNQCCGGAVSVVTEVFDLARFHDMDPEFAGVWARPVSMDAGPMPATLKRKLTRAEHSGTPFPLTYQNGWLAEAVWRTQRQVVIYGAGHVGHALATVLAPLPQFRVYLSDPRVDLLAGLPPSVAINAGLSTDMMAAAEPDAAHFIMTPEHDYDLELCHHHLTRDFGFAGLIGSATKWARFRKRLAALGHAPDRIDQITCPIGDPKLGKHPQAIALGVAAHMLTPAMSKLTQKEALV